MKTTNMKTITKILTGATASIIGAMAFIVPAYGESPEFSVREQIKLGEAGKWDYVAIDSTHQRLFVTRGTHVQVVDLTNGKPFGQIADTDGVHGVAFAPDLNLGFTSNGRANSVTVFELDSLKVKQEIKITGQNPDAIYYDAKSHKVFTFNGKSNNVTVIDANTLQVVGTIQASGRPEFAVGDQSGRIYFNIEDKEQIDVIDVASNKLVAQWSLAGCTEPTGLAIDVAHARLFSACQNNIVAVTDLHDGKRATSFAIGEHPDAVVYDADTGRVYSSNGGSGTLTIAQQKDADHYTVIANVATEKGAKTMAFDPKTKVAYLPALINKEFSLLVVAPK
jgi:YVTN family beta-propeller protein